MSKVIAWIHLPGLPNEYWARKLIVVDVNMEKLLKRVSARACIEVDLTKTLIVGAIVGKGEDKFF